MNLLVDKESRDESVEVTHRNESCSNKGRFWDCARGICPGTALGLLLLAGWGLVALVQWVWALIVG